MKRIGNYLIQAVQAKKHFLTYDQSQIIKKFHLSSDRQYIYVNLLCKLYRIHRLTGDLEKQSPAGWTDANSYEEVMTVLDLVCGSHPNPRPAHRWKTMQAFGLQFHRNLLENQKDPDADHINQHPEAFQKACAALGGVPIPGGDLAFAVSLFDRLEIGIQFWYADSEFLPRLRYLWDENALQYIRYETMYFAVTLLLQRIDEEMRKFYKTEASL